MHDNPQIKHTVSLTSPAGWPLLAWLPLFILLVTLLQLYVPYPVDDDTAYHFAVARLMAKQGFLYSFPWTPFSWQFDHYADKELLFHLLLIPLSGFEFVTAARIMGVFCGVLILVTLFLILRAEKVRCAGIWTLLPLAASIFLFRFAQVRPHLLSIALALLFVWAAARGRLKILAFASLIYPLAYVAFWQIPLMLIFATETARRLSGEHLRWKPAAVVLLGIICGVIIHPNSYNLISMNWIHMYNILFQNAWGEKIEFSLGEEFDPFSIMDFVKYLGVNAGMAFVACVIAWRERTRSSVPLAFAIASLFFGLLTVRTNRFLEYFVPFSAMALAVATRMSSKRFIAPALLGILLFCTLLFGTAPYENLTSLDTKNGYIDPSTARFFEQHIPVGSQLFTCNYYYTGGLMMSLPGRYFLVALDPTLLYMKDPHLYETWYRTLLLAPPESAEVVRNQFKSRFVACQNYSELWPFFNALASDSNANLLFSSKKWLLFDLGQASSL